MMHRSTLLPLALVLAFGAGEAAAQHSAPRSATVDARGVRTVHVRAGAGTLRVEGREGLGEVEARGTAHAPGRDVLEQIRIRTERHGDEIHIETEIPRGNWNRSSPRLDLTVDVPEGVSVVVVDGSGEAVVRGVAAARIEDGSGSLRVEQILGEVSIEDGSGEIHVSSVGSLRLVDGSGEVVIEDVAGDVRLSDGSGQVTARRVRGSVRVDSDGSGGLDFRGIRGHVHIGRDGSGGIRVRDVGGDLRVDSDGSGGVDVDGVRGRVQIP